MLQVRHLLSLIALALATIAVADVAAADGGRRRFALDANAAGVVETLNNIANLTVVSRDANVLKAEYRAGFVQGKLQAKGIRSARDNSWDSSYLTDPSHAFPRQHGPSAAELARAGRILDANYEAFLRFVRNPTTDSDAASKLKRLVFRMLGIYHGATRDAPAALDFSGAWLPDQNYFKPAELALGYETSGLSFMDVYYINAASDLGDVIAYAKDAGLPSGKAEKCSAFVKRTKSDIILAHNTWSGYLSQSMAVTLAVNDDLMTVNAESPGLLASQADFGYNNKGILFNETTHRAGHSQVRPDGVFIFWRIALAAEFATSIDDFFRYVSLDNSGTYLNGYMVVDAGRGETGLVEMSYRCFVFYRSSGGDYAVTTKSSDGGLCRPDYDRGMVTPDYIMGINFPASLQVREDLGSTDNRPARRRQFAELLPGVDGIESAKRVITYTDPKNPLSIYGRWDLGYGETAYPKQVPDGSIDAKAATASMVRSFMRLKGTLDPRSRATGFWMRYGTAHVAGAPFIWSRSSWNWQKRRDVPDRVDGHFVLLPLRLR